MTLALIGVVLGASMMVAFRRLANTKELRRAMNRIQAHLIEFWLYQDEPSMVWKSWKGLLAANARFLGLLIAPLVVLGAAITPVWFWLDARYGTAPLALHQPALVSIGMDQMNAVPALQTPDGIAIEGPPVRVISEHEVSWRIRPSAAVSGMIRLGSVTKTIDAGQGSPSRRRSQSLISLIRYPMESLLPAGPIDWIDVSYPAAMVTLFGMEAHWSAWFLLFSSLGAILAMKV